MWELKSSPVVRQFPIIGVFSDFHHGVYEMIASDGNDYTVRVNAGQYLPGTETGSKYSYGVRLEVDGRTTRWHYITREDAYLDNDASNNVRRLLNRMLDEFSGVSPRAYDYIRARSIGNRG